MKCSYYARLLY